MTKEERAKVEVHIAKHGAKPSKACSYCQAFRVPGLKGSNR